MQGREAAQSGSLLCCAELTVVAVHAAVHTQCIQLSLQLIDRTVTQRHSGYLTSRTTRQ